MDVWTLFVAIFMGTALANLATGFLVIWLEKQEDRRIDEGDK